MNQIQPNKFFKWQGSYAAFSVNHQSLNAITTYIQNQTTHHQQQTLIPNWEIPTNTPS
jgi:putative transposase